MKTSRESVNELGISPNKALGQNFLIDESAIESIVSSATAPLLPIIEIGPGLGALTLPLAESGLPLAAIELDSNLCSVLEGQLPKNAKVINVDFMKADLSAIHRELGGGELSVVGNLPYYITSPICMRLVTSALPIRSMTLMMQKEAADRFTAQPKDKNYVPLAILARLRFDITSLLDLSPASYYPQPDVASRVLRFESRGFQLPSNLPRLLKCAFAMRRKTLVNNLSAMGLDRKTSASLLEKSDIPPSARAEELSPEQFVSLAQVLELENSD